MKTQKLEAPWYTFRKKVAKLFEGDPEIIVSELYEPVTKEAGGPDFALDIEVRNHEKFVALARLLPLSHIFGNVSVEIIIYDEANDGSTADNVKLYETIFDGNPILQDIKTATDIHGVKHGYVRFKPEVLQFPNDDISDYSGNWSGLAQDIAREVFADDFSGVHFCTADAREKIDG